ncbi:MAG: hypothetical protein U1E20_02870 [Methylocystis sp.]|uniref:hypothetical protein n=1 Tax=Methylocystis sp. TaxID=1911079 RepID=UPI003927BF05
MRVFGEVRSISELMSVITRRRYELWIASLALDDIAGVADGCISKLECGTKRPGEVSPPSIMDALGIRLQVIVDDDALPARTRRAIGTSQYVQPADRLDEPADLAA